MRQLPDLLKRTRTACGVSHSFTDLYESGYAYYQAVSALETKGISTADGGYPSIVINDGRVIDTNLRKLGLDRNWLSAELKRQGRGSEKDIFLMTVNQSREVYISVKEAVQ